MAKGYWLVKSEPSVYPWERFVKEKRTTWDGVRSFEARNNLRAMKKGDLVLFYHSNEGKEVVGLATVSAEATPEKTNDEGEWSVVELVCQEDAHAPGDARANQGREKAGQLWAREEEPALGRARNRGRLRADPGAVGHQALTRERGACSSRSACLRGRRRARSTSPALRFRASLRSRAGAGLSALLRGGVARPRSRAGCP